MMVVNRYNSNPLKPYKELMMFTINKSLVIFILSAFFSASSASMESNISVDESARYVIKKNDQVLNFLRKNVAVSTVNFEKRMSFCEQQKAKESVLLLDSKHLKNLGVSRNQVMTGLIYLDYKNTVKCEGNTRLKFAYDIGTLVAAQIRYQISANETLEIASGLAYPSVELLEHLANYSTLPFELREYLEKTIGERLFNVLSSIEHLQLP